MDIRGTLRLFRPFPTSVIYGLVLIIIPNLSKGPVADPIQSEDPSSKPNVSEGAHTDSQDVSTAQESVESNEPGESRSEQPVLEIPEFGETITVVPVGGEDGSEPLDGSFECWVETSSFVRKGRTNLSLVEDLLPWAPTIQKNCKL